MNNERVGRSQVSLTTVFTVCFGVLLVYGAVLFVTNSLLAITLSVCSLMIAVALDHGVAFLQSRGLRRSLAIGVVALLAVGLAAGLGFTVIPTAVTQGKQFLVKAPEYISQAGESRLFHRIDIAFQSMGGETRLADRVALELRQRLPGLVGNAAGSLFRLAGGLLDVVVGVVTITFLSIFMLIFGGPLVQAGLAQTLPERRDRYARLLDKIYSLIGGYLGGLTLICTINATATIAFLAIVRVPYSLPLGLASGFSSMVPYAGPFIAGLTVSLIAATTVGMWKGLACVIYFLVYGQIEGNVLGPLVFRRTVHVNPLIVMLSILFLGELAGIIGAVLAVPITAAAQIVLREWLRSRKEATALVQAVIGPPGAG